MNNKGREYEDLACNYLKRQGLKLIARNFQRKSGEIDLIMRQDKTLVFVEVRFRRNSRFGTPLETITRSKMQKLINTAWQYLQLTNATNQAFRFDAIAIQNSAAQTPEITWIRNCIETTN
ncbi:endonuclease [Oleiphilus messinensis]|uniref:UPF0102 protein OLMES_4710 n=1 Tax=Oleiphilus messinensis TaxID=141451 RepID=A0A1Y0IH39_9GAMM|nr:YraN family protein [Oleiphilus messinensis]ARU58704.1 endonuclease [Oleiphilus messinensis]